LFVDLDYAKTKIWLVRPEKMKLKNGQQIANRNLEWCEDFNMSKSESQIPRYLAVHIRIEIMKEFEFFGI